jgi:toxin ParE1/3/4
MTRVRLSSKAQTDLDDIWIYIAKDSLTNADKFIDRLLETVQKILSTAPLAGRQRDELGEGLRSLPFERYMVFYRVENSAVEIGRILHSARDIEAVFGEKL